MLNLSQQEVLSRAFSLKYVKIGAYAAAINVATHPLKQSSNNPYEGKAPAGIEKDRVIAISKLGTPIYTNLEIQAGSYTQNGVTYEYPSLTIDTVIMTVNDSKNIVKTQISGRKGTVKEYISDGDSMINIKAAFMGDNGVFPVDDVIAMQKICKAPVPIKVTSWWLQLFDIDTIVIENVSHPQREGFYSSQLFDINALSDLPVELKISQ